MANQEDYDEYSDEDEGDDLHAECLHCGTLNRFPGKDIPKILCYECGEIIEAPASMTSSPPPPQQQTAKPATPQPQAPKTTNQLPSSSYSAPKQDSYKGSNGPSSSHPSLASSHEKEKEKKKSIFSLKKKKDKEKEAPALLGGGNPSISSPVFVKHVSGATQADEAEKLIVGNRPPPNVPIDVERKSRAMAIPIGVEQKPLVGGNPNVSAPTNVRKCADPLAALSAPEGKKPNMSKEEKKMIKEKEKMEKKAKKLAEKEAKKFGKTGVVLEKRKFSSSSAAANVPPPGITNQPQVSVHPPASSSSPSVPPSSPPQVLFAQTTPPAIMDDDEDEISEFCGKCGSLNVFPPGVDCVACYECDTPIQAPPASSRPPAALSVQSNAHSESEEDDDEITEPCPACNTLNAFPSDAVPQIACYSCGSAINNPKLNPNAVEEEGEEGELQAFCKKCGSLNIFPPGVFAVACWECETPIYYNS